MNLSVLALALPFGLLGGTVYFGWRSIYPVFGTGWGIAAALLPLLVALGVVAAGFYRRQVGLVETIIAGTVLGLFLSVPFALFDFFDPLLSHRAACAVAAFPVILITLFAVLAGLMKRIKRRR